MSHTVIQVDASGSSCGARPPVPVVELDNIHKTYLLGLEGVPALRGVSLTLYAGEWVVIYGTSGGGKSSLLNIVGTIDKPTKGKLWIGGKPITSETTDEILAAIRLAQLGFVFQSFNLISSMTAAENVELPMTLKGTLSVADCRRKARASLQRVGLGHRLDHFPTQLSGGEQQRCTIARAIANEPAVLLLDEPTGDLDTGNTHRIIDLLVALNTEQNMTMLMVTHDVYLKNLAHRVIYMRDGKVAREERVPADVRARAIAEVRTKLASLGMVSAATTPAVAANGMSSSNSSNQVHQDPVKKPFGGPSPASTATTIRRPQDYATFSPAALKAAMELRNAFVKRQPPSAATPPMKP
ncbi:P-loop containing nucleoside triphosphate hydrolase protein [Blastocladiella britannica]|nr:P-loop containing nucleoside triphosphate hydrolase protein [Blastocladiella britannica]